MSLPNASLSSNFLYDNKIFMLETSCNNLLLVDVVVLVVFPCVITSRQS